MTILSASIDTLTKDIENLRKIYWNLIQQIPKSQLYNPYLQNHLVVKSFYQLLQLHLGDPYSKVLYSSIIPSSTSHKYVLYQNQICELSKIPVTIKHYVPISNYHWLNILNAMLWVCCNILRQKIKIRPVSKTLAIDDFGLFYVLYNCIFLMKKAQATPKQILLALEDYYSSNYWFVNPVKAIPQLKAQITYQNISRYEDYLIKRLVPLCLQFNLITEANHLHHIIRRHRFEK